MSDESRELDARVLHAACGWRWMSRRLHAGTEERPPGVNENGAWDETPWSPVDHWPAESERFEDWCGAWLGHMPSPSLIVADAMDCLEAIPDTMWQVTRYRDIEGTSAGCRYTCMIRRSQHEVVSGMVGSLPLAICGAILKWVEVTK
jgi:hypothetical protein